MSEKVITLNERYELAHEVMYHLAIEENLPVIPLCTHNHDGMTDEHCKKCKTLGETPLISNWRTIEVPSVKTLEQWKKEFPKCNIGLILGNKSNIIKLESFDDSGHSEMINTIGDTAISNFTFTYQDKYGLEKREISLYKIPDDTLICRNVKNVERKAINKNTKKKIGFEILAQDSVAVLPPSLNKSGFEPKFNLFTNFIDEDKETYSLRDLTPASKDLLELITNTQDISHNQNHPKNIIKKLSNTNEITEVIDIHSEPVKDENESPLDNDTLIPEISVDEIATKLLLQKCEAFNRDVEIQKTSGLNECQWKNYSYLFSNLGYFESALNFSKLSEKHNKESEKLLEKLKKDHLENGTRGTTRCLSLGCNIEKIKKCTGGKIRKNDNDEISNSPAYHISKRKVDREYYLKNAKATMKNVFFEISKGDSGAHLTDDALLSAAVIAFRDKAEFARIQTKLRALKVPLREFMKQVNRNLHEMDNSNIDERPENPIYDDWFIDVDNFEKYPLSSKGCFCTINDDKPTEMCNFCARISKVFTYTDGLNEPTKCFELEIIIKNGVNHPNIRVSIEELSSGDYILSKGGAELIVNAYTKYPQILESIQLYSNNKKHVTVYTHFGLTKINGKYCYIHSGGIIGDESSLVDIEDQHLKKYALPNDTKYTLKESTEALLTILHMGKKEILLPILSYIMLSILSSFLEEINLKPEFVLCVLGHTGTFKTTTAMLFLSFFGKFTCPPANFSCTANSMELKAFSYKDTLLVVDDAHPGSDINEKRQIQKKLQSLARSYGDSVPKARMTANIKMQNIFPPRGLALITGEEPITGQSSIARVPMIEIEKGDINKVLLTRAQKNSHLYPYAMRGFIEWFLCHINNNYDETVSLLEGNFESYRKEASSEEQHNRLPEVVSWLMIGMDFFLAYAQEVGAISESNSRLLEEESYKVFTNLAKNQNKMITQQKPVDNFLTALRELFANKEIFTRPTNPNLVNDPSNSSMVGWHDDTFYYLLPKLVYGIVCNFLVKSDIHLGASSSQLWKQLASLDYIIKDKDGHTHPYKVMEKNRHRLLHLKKASIEKFDQKQ